MQFPSHTFTIVRLVICSFSSKYCTIRFAFRFVSKVNSAMTRLDSTLMIRFIYWFTIDLMSLGSRLGVRMGISFFFSIGYAKNLFGRICFANGRCRLCSSTIILSIPRIFLFPMMNHPCFYIVQELLQSSFWL